MGASARLISLIRGVHTKNARLVLLIATYTVDMTDASLNQKDVLKQFMNEYLRWLDADAIALFNNYANYLPHHMPLKRPLHPATQFAAPIENLHNHIDFVDHVSSILKTLSICEPLYSILHTLSNIIVDFNAATRQQRLQNIGFGCVQSFVDGPVTELEPISSFFNPLQIVLRSEYSEIDLFLRTSTKTFEFSVELALLDLTSSKSINALAVLEVVEDPYYLRSLLFPPFRLEEFTVNKVETSNRIINLQRRSVDDDAVHAEISLRFSNSVIMDRWLGHLRQLFSSDILAPHAFALPTTFSNESLSSIGLGINLHETSTQHSNLSLDDFTPPSTATLDNFFGPPSIRSTLPLSQLQKRAQELPMSSTSNLLSLSNDIDFEPKSKYTAPLIASSGAKSAGDVNNMIEQENPIKGQLRKDSDSSESSSRIKKVGSNSAESSFYKTQPVNVDVSNFGRSHQPSFSLVGISDTASATPPKKEGSNDGKKQKKGFFSIFKKKKRAQRSPNLPQLLPIKMDTPRQTQDVVGDVESIVSSSDECNDHEAEFTGSRVQQTASEPGLAPEAIKSATSLPAAFALPQSTSMTFFKQHVSSDNIALLSTKNGNASSASLATPEPALIVGEELKTAINSEDSIDYYISSATPKAMKVSRWKEKYGKWEMLTINERLFLKIVVSHAMKKCWLLVFKEEFDEEDQEEYDAPILIMDVDMKSIDARKTSALDLQICATNSITKVSNLILIRCVTGSLSNTILQRLKEAAQLAAVGELSRQMTLANSDSTLVSSFMSSSLSDQSHSPNTTEELPARGKKSSSSTTTIEESTLISMQVRLLKLSSLHGDIHDPAAWQILAMYMLDLCVVCDLTDNSYYYKFAFSPMEGEGQSIKPHSWLIPESQREEKLGCIGKAGLLVELDTKELFMIECRGTKEFQQLYECL